MTRRFFVQGVLLAEDQEPLIWRHEERGRPFSEVLVCTECGDAWARIEVSGRRYVACGSRCPACPPESVYWNWLPGSLLGYTNTQDLSSLPDAVLIREFNLHLAHAIKEIQHAAEI